MDVATFREIQRPFMQRAERIVWCTVATVDRAGRPRTRILHPIWEDSTGWILTNRRSLKSKHIEANPNVSLLYWDPQQETATVEAIAEWVDDPAQKQRIWSLFEATPPPVGYSPGDFFPAGPTGDATGLLKLTARRIVVATLSSAGFEYTTWQA